MEKPMVTKEKGVCLLPLDLLIDILCLLPVKALAQMRCVSKSWCHLISDPYFQNLYRYRSRKQNPLLLFLIYLHGPKSETEKDNDGKFTFCLSSIDAEGWVHTEFTKQATSYLFMQPSCFNLVCLLGLKSGIFLCNPSTHEFMTLPETSPSALSYQIVGFGYLPTRKEYKVVHLFYRYFKDFRYEDYDIGCEVFTVGGSAGSHGSWRVIEENCPYPVDHSGQYPAFVNGALHWVVWDHFYDVAGYDDGLKIVSFDIESEKFKTIPYPSDWPTFYHFRLLLMELGGFLCLIDQGDEEELFMDIWMLKDYDNHEWVKQYSIGYLGVPIGIRDGELITKTDISKRKVRICYNSLENDSYRIVENRTTNWKGWSAETFYVDSLFSLGMGWEVDKSDLVLVST